MRFCDNNNLGALLYVDAFDLALQAHKNQVDKCGEPYFLHPMRIAAYFQGLDDADAAIVALLHDIVEDTWVSLGFLEDRFPENIVDAVDAITRRKDEQYKQYVRRCIQNDIARRVKKQDVLDNLRLDRMWRDAPLSRYYWTLAAIEGYERNAREKL